VLDALEGLVAAGVSVAEISLSPPTALATLREAAARFGDAITLGAGTVRTVAQADQALAAGARFLVAPGLDETVMAHAARQDVLHLPGVFSPTEVDRALSAGAVALKLFPAGRLGPGYVSDLLGPFPEARIVATGGVDAGNAAAFLDAGCLAVAGSSALMPETGPRLSAAEVEGRARRLISSLSTPTTKDQDVN
jgi:Entner-Doudoroff aldolase